MIEKLGKTVEFISEQREGFSGNSELFRGSELLAGDIERLETLCHWSASAPLSGRQVSPHNTSFTVANPIVTSAERSNCSSTDCQSAKAIPPPIILRGYIYIYIYIIQYILTALYIYMKQYIFNCNLVDIRRQ